MRRSSVSLSAGCLRLLLAVGLATPLAAVVDQPPAAAPAPQTWRAQVERAVAALAIGDHDAAHRSISRLAALRPESPLPPYLDARLATREGDAEGAYRNYQRILTAFPEVLDEEWSRLVAARWVRARHARDHVVAQAALARSEPAPEQAGRCLVAPLEALVLDPGDATTAVELEALGYAAADWLIRALWSQPAIDPLGLQAAVLLRRGHVPSALGSPQQDPGSAAPIPPVTTLEGAAHRLARLAPSGPPPWAPATDTPARYYAPPETPDERAIPRALAHFQQESGLAPTGVLDPATRAALERAYRDRGRPTRRAPTPGGTDPLLHAARRAGAQAVLSGTLERLADGTVRWNVAWVAAAGGELLAAPLSGRLPRERFREAWQAMVTQVVTAFAPESPRPALTMAEMPSYPAAVRYGRARLRLAAGEEAAARRLLAQLERDQIGPTAYWWARAWLFDPGALARLEERLLESEVRGPQPFDEGAMLAVGAALAGGIWCGEPGSNDGWATRSGTLGGLPAHGWLRVIGTLDGE